MHFSGNMTWMAKDSISALMRLHQEPLGGKYLGLPICIPCSKKKIACQEIKDEVRRKVTGRKAKALSQTGRTALIQAVASAFPSYFMTVFMLPQEVLRELHRLLKNFWWGFPDDQQRHFHPKLWHAICTPKELGGVGYSSWRN